MFDRKTIVAGITRWSDLGVQLPKPLTAKLEAFDAVRYVEAGHAVTVDTAAITPENADEAVADLAVRLLPTTQFAPGEPSALARAKVAILDALASEILSEAYQAVPDVIEQLRPSFDEAVSAFVSAVQILPETLTSDALVAAGPSTLAEYQTAREAASVIATMDSWLASLSQLPAFAVLPSSPATRVLAPANRAEFAKLRSALENRRADAAEKELREVFVVAAREGIAFNLNSPIESARIIESMQQTVNA